LQNLASNEVHAEMKDPFEEALNRLSAMALKLEVLEKKRADVLAVNRDLLQSKLDLER